MYALLTVARSRLATGNVDAAREAYGRLEGSPDALATSLAVVGRADLAMHLGRPAEAIKIMAAAAPPKPATQSRKRAEDGPG